MLETMPGMLVTWMQVCSRYPFCLRHSTLARVMSLAWKGTSDTEARADSTTDARTKYLIIEYDKLLIIHQYHIHQPSPLSFYPQPHTNIKQNYRSYISLMRPTNMIIKIARSSFLFATHKPRPYTGRSYQEVRSFKDAISPVYTHYYKQPFLPVEGYKEFLYDHNGREYIDLIGGISCMNVGHSHPRITKIYKEETARLINLSSHYVNQYQGEFAEKLCKELGNDLDTVFFFNSGSQANDFAYNLAKAHTKSNTVVSLRNAYHGTAGNSYNLTSLGIWNTSLPKGNAIERLAWPNFYRNAHSSVESLIKDAEEQLDCNTNGKVAGLWLEPVMGAGGIIPLQKSYVQTLHKMVKKMGGLYISDEVQTGFGRIGKDAWGFKWQQVKPDMVIMAKAIANASPFSAVVTRREIADSLTHDYFPTFAGGPIECRIGMEVLDIIKEEKLAENADEIGDYLISEFRRIGQKSKYIGDVRGKGMLLAVEFVKDKINKEPNVELLAQVFEKGREAGVLFGKGGHKGHLIRVLGPLCLSRKSAEKAMGVFEDIMTKIG